MSLDFVSNIPKRIEASAHSEFKFRKIHVDKSISVPALVSLYIDTLGAFLLGALANFFY